MAEGPPEPTTTTGLAASAPSPAVAPQPPPRPHAAMAETNGNIPIPELENGSSTQIRPGGAPARVYLNELVVPHLLEGMKSVAKDQPANPLRVLGEFLIQRSKELEGDTK